MQTFGVKIKKMIDSFSRPAHNLKFGHFTSMAKERAKMSNARTGHA